MRYLVLVAANAIGPATTIADAEIKVMTLKLQLSPTDSNGMQAKFLDPQDKVPGMEHGTIADFWRWAYSDVLSNGNRSIFAEFIVGNALGCLDKPRSEWDPVDLKYRGFGIEVKASADCQSWHQTKPSRICFSVKKATFWDRDTSKYEGGPTRSAHCYIFCHFSEQNKEKANVLNVPAWDFYVMPVEAVNRAFKDQKSVSLSAVRRNAVHCKFTGLREAVDAALGLAAVS